MSTEFSIDTEIRTVVGKRVKYLREQGIIPATIYGKNFGPVSVQADWRSFHAAYEKVGRTKPITLNIPGHESQVAIIKDIQRHPVSRNIMHADFQVVEN